MLCLPKYANKQENLGPNASVVITCLILLKISYK